MDCSLDGSNHGNSSAVNRRYPIKTDDVALTPHTGSQECNAVDTMDINSHRCPEGDSHRCPECDLVCPTVVSLRQHLTAVHNMTAEHCSPLRNACDSALQIPLQPNTVKTELPDISSGNHEKSVNTEAGKNCQIQELSQLMMNSNPANNNTLTAERCDPFDTDVPQNHPDTLNVNAELVQGYSDEQTVNNAIDGRLEAEADVKLENQISFTVSGSSLELSRNQAMYEENKPIVEITHRLPRSTDQHHSNRMFFNVVKCEKRKAAYGCYLCGVSFPEFSLLQQHVKDPCGQNHYVERTPPRKTYIKPHHDTAIEVPGETFFKSDCGLGESTSYDHRAKDGNRDYKRRLYQCSTCGQKFALIMNLKKHTCTPTDLDVGSSPAKLAYVSPQPAQLNTGSPPKSEIASDCPMPRLQAQAVPPCETEMEASGKVNFEAVQVGPHRSISTRPDAQVVPRRPLPTRPEAPWSTRSKYHPDNWHHCYVCGESFPYFFLLKEHIKEPCGTNVRWLHKCNICGDCFPDLSHLRQHVVKPCAKNHRCPQCDQFCPTLISLQQHVTAVHDMKAEHHTPLHDACSRIV